MLNKITISAATLAVVFGEHDSQDDQSQKCSGDKEEEGCQEYNWQKNEKLQAAFKTEWEKCFDPTGVIHCKPRRAVCKMMPNPAHPTTNPMGWFQLIQFSPTNPLYIWGNMWNLPPQAINAPHPHAFAINEREWDMWNDERQDCCSAGRHWHPFMPGTHGQMNTSPSHYGDLK